MNIDNFTGRAEAYAKGRPGYTKEAVDKIVELAPNYIRWDSGKYKNS